MREGGFCAILIQTARKSLILNGEMSEWLKEHAWKACVGETLPRVRIPLSPPIYLFNDLADFGYFTPLACQRVSGMLNWHPG